MSELNRAIFAALSRRPTSLKGPIDDREAGDYNNEHRCYQRFTTTLNVFDKLSSNINKQILQAAAYVWILRC